MIGTILLTNSAGPLSPLLYASRRSFAISCSLPKDAETFDTYLDLMDWNRIEDALSKCDDLKVVGFHRSGKTASYQEDVGRIPGSYEGRTAEPSQKGVLAMGFNSKF